MDNNHFTKKILLNGEWVDSFRTLSDINSRHSALFRTAGLKKEATSKLKNKSNARRLHKKKHQSSISSDKKAEYNEICPPIPIQRSFSDSLYHSGNIKRSCSSESGYSGLPLNSPFRTISDMFDIASISRHKNFYFQSTAD